MTRSTHPSQLKRATSSISSLIRRDLLRLMINHHPQKMGREPAAVRRSCPTSFLVFIRPSPDEISEWQSLILLHGKTTLLRNMNTSPREFIYHATILLGTQELQGRYDTEYGGEWGEYLDDGYSGR